MKISEEIENSPDDDDNLFSDPKPIGSQRSQFNDFYGLIFLHVKF